MPEDPNRRLRRLWEAKHQNRDQPYGPVLSSTAPRGRAPCWIASIVEHRETGGFRIGVGILAPGLLTAEQAEDLAARLIRLAQDQRLKRSGG
jgi:hypothetical protein